MITRPAFRRSRCLHIRYCLAQVRNRGYGLGNELIPWARALLAALLLDAYCFPPAFGLNRRRYWRHFGTPRYDWLRNRTLPWLLPRVEFTEADWRRHGAGDVLVALRGFAAEHRLLERRAYVFVTTGMWGGYTHIEAARMQMRAILQTSRYAARNLVRLAGRLDPARITVGMHVRFGDFRPADSVQEYRGVWNTALPMEWYVNVAQSLRREFGAEAQFLVVSDGTAEQLRPLLEAVPCVTTTDIPDSDCSDLLALADADLLVCSISSYSQWAAFLSQAPYLWYAPSLHVHPGERGSIWGGSLHNAGTPTDNGSLPRGIPVALSGALPPALPLLLRQRRAFLRPDHDLVRGGLAPLRTGNIPP
jgi:hypothetical protein